MIEELLGTDCEICETGLFIDAKEGRGDVEKVVHECQSSEAESGSYENKTDDVSCLRITFARLKC